MHIEPARKEQLTKLAALWGVKRFWLEPDWLLRWRCGKQFERLTAQNNLRSWKNGGEK